MKKLAVLLLFLGMGFVAIWFKYAETNHYPDLGTTPLWDENRLELVANLDMPPGNISVSPGGRVFITLHPDAFPDVNVAELVDGQIRPFPSVNWQPGGSEELALYF